MLESTMKLPFVLDRPMAFFDIETTGLSTTRDRIIELALIRLSPQGDVLERVRRFNPLVELRSRSDTWDRSRMSPFPATAR